MRFERNELQSGVFFNAIKEEKFKSNLISLRFIVPLSLETAAKNALIFPVLLRGSEKFPDLGSISREEESIYDTDISENATKRGDLQILELRMSLLDDRYAIDGMKITERGMALLEDLLLCPVTENGVFRSDYVESEKKTLTEDIRGQVNDKRRYAMRRAVEEMFENDVFGVSELGTEETVAAVCPTCLYKQYKEVLARARIEIFAVGNFDTKALRDRFSAMFGKVERGEVYCAQTVPMVSARAKVKTVYERQSITQGKLAMGFYTGHVSTDMDYAAMQVMNTVYGGGVTGKLFMNVREKLSLCYYCSSMQNGEKGYMLVNAGIEFAKEKQTADEILLQLDHMKNGNITEGEISDAKLAIVNSLGGVKDSTGAILGWYFGCIMNGDMVTPEEKAARVNAVTKEDIVRIANDVKLDTYYFLCGKETK